MYSYPIKIWLALIESIKGNTSILRWLISESTYQEIGFVVYALHNKPSARKWLMSHKYYYWMAFIEGVEGKEDAIKWLRKHQYIVLSYVAEASDNNRESLEWLIKHNLRLFVKLSLTIRKVKNTIQRNNEDYHQINP